MRTFYCQKGHAYREFESSWTSTAGIDVKNTSAVHDRRLMRVAADHYLKESSRVYRDFFQVVKHVDRYTIDF